MCRLLGMVFDEERGPKYVLDGNPSLELLSRVKWRYGGREIGPQDDGWGMAWIEDDVVRLFRTTTPLHESHCAREILSQTRSRAYLFHLRKVSKEFSFTRSILNTQPFADCRMAFAHNGTVKGLVAAGRRSGKSDSRMLYEFLQDFVDLGEGLREVVRRFGTSSTSLNSIVLTEGGLYVLNFFAEGANADYYTMYLKRGEGAVFVASQPMDGSGWSPIGNGRLVRIGLDLKVVFEDVLS